MDDLVHRCRAGKKCLARTPDGAAQTMKPETLCNGCIAAIQSALDDLPALKEALRSFVAVPIAGGGYSESVSSTKEPQSPMNARVVDLIDEIADVLVDVGTLPVRDLVNQAGDNVMVWQSNKIVRTFHDGVDRALRIRSVHSRADDIVGLSATWERKGAPCPHCGSFTLGGWAGGDILHCTNCTGTLTRTAYENMCVVRVERK